MNIPDGYLVTEQHEWIKAEEDEGLIGITDHASEQLGGITFIDLPAEGDELSQTEPFAEVESVKAVSDIYAPASGVVSKINETLSCQPELINQDPYGDGWICRIQLSDTEELDDLMNAEAYGHYLEELDE